MDIFGVREKTLSDVNSCRQFVASEVWVLYLKVGSMFGGLVLYRWF